MHTPKVGDYLIVSQLGLCCVWEVTTTRFSYRNNRGGSGSVHFLSGRDVDEFWISPKTSVHEVWGERRNRTLTVQSLDFDENMIVCLTPSGEQVVFDKGGMRSLARGPAKNTAAA